MTPPSIVDNDYNEDDPEPVMVEEKAEEESCMDSSKNQVEEAKVDTSMEQSDIGKDTEEKGTEGPYYALFYVRITKY